MRDDLQLSAEVAALSRLNELSSRLWQMPSLREGLDQVVAATLDLLGGDQGHVELVDAEGCVVRIATHRGLDREIEGTEADAGGWQAAQSSPLIGRDGTLLGVLSTQFATMRELTDQELRWLDLFVRQAAGFIERSRAEAKFQESQRRKDDFLAILAHELRNPLGPVRNAAHYLRLRNLPDPELRTSIDMIERQVAHMVRLIDDLLDVSRITRGALELRPERVQIGEVIQAAIDVCRGDVDARGHTLHMERPDVAIELQADRARLIQILSNLIVNAAKYTPPGGLIALRATAENGNLEFRVKDNGIGIPPAKLREIFELFTQVDRSFERQGGLGIGLTLVRRLAELHGGSIEARSAGAGHGSEFILTLPIAVDDRPRVYSTDVPQNRSIEARVQPF